MEYSQQENTFYEAMWFGEDDSVEPVVRGSNVEELITELLDITKGRDGFLEVYQISYNNKGYRIQLYKKFEVLNELQL